MEKIPQAYRGFEGVGMRRLSEVADEFSFAIRPRLVTSPGASALLLRSLLVLEVAFPPGRRSHASFCATRSFVTGRTSILRAALDRRRRRWHKRSPRICGFEEEKSEGREEAFAIKSSASLQLYAI